MTKFVTCSCASEWRDEAYLILRVVTGLAFFYHGYSKVFGSGLEKVTDFFAGSGIPMANIIAPLVAYGELLGGLALMLGFLTHWVSKAFIVIMIGAIGFVHWGAVGGWFNGYGAPNGYEYPLLLLAVSVFFMVFGSGKYSIDAKYGSMYGLDSN